MDVDKIKAIVEALEGTEVTHLDYRNGEERILIHRGQQPVLAAPAAVTVPVAAPAMSIPVPVVGPAPAVTAAVLASAPAAGSAPAPGALAPAPASPGVIISSPFVGTFYRAPSPDAPPFAEVGQTVRKGQPLCIVEAMKLMNEIEAEVGGKIAEVFAQNGQAVEFGEPLFRIEPA